MRKIFLWGLLLITSELAWGQSLDDDPIIVTATPLQHTVESSITGISVLSGNALRDRLAATLGETLKTQAGVSSSFFGAGASRPLIRGQGGDRIRILTNGIGSLDAANTSPDHAVAVEPAQAERIEIVRGAALLRYGSSGSGGVVNVIDGRFSNALPKRKLSSDLRLATSAVDGAYEGAGALRFQVADNLIAHLGGAYRRAQPYAIPVAAESAALQALEGEPPAPEFNRGGRRLLPNSQARSSSISTGLSYVGSDGYFGIAVQDFDSLYGIPGEGHEEEEEVDVRISLDQQRLDINGVWQLDGVFEKAQIFAGFADYTHTEFEGNEVGTRFVNMGEEVRLEVVQSQIAAWSAAHGVHYRGRDFSAMGEEAFVPPTQMQQWGCSVFMN